MPAKGKWDDEEESSSAASSPKFTATRRNKFEDEEDGDSDVLDSWDAAEDSEVEREKAKKAAEAKAKAEAEAKANKKSKTQRIAMHQADRAAAKAAADAESSEEEESETEKRDRLRRAQKESDLRHAEDLFGDVGVSGRRTNTLSAAVPIDPSDPNKTVDLGSLPLFNPRTKTQLDGLNKIVTPLLAQNHKMPNYVLFVQDLTKVLVKELPSDQVKKIASTLTTISNEKMKTEKAGEKTGKKKAKGKTSLNTTRNNVEDVDAYQDNDAFDDGDFM